MSKPPVDPTTDEQEPEFEFIGVLDPGEAPRRAPRSTRSAAKPRAKFKRGTGAVRKRGNVWWIRYYRNGKRIEERTGARNETEARKVLNERMGKVAEGITPAAVSRVRVSELYADMQADYRNNDQDLGTLRDRWKHLEPAFGNDFARNVTQPRLQQYIDRRREEGAAEQTVKLEIAALRRMMRLGYENRKVGQLPAFPRITVNNTRTNFFENDDVTRLLTALREVIAAGRDVGNDWLVPFVIVARWTGMRRDEMLTLERRQVTLDGRHAGRVALDPGTTKTKDGRVFYLPAEALAALRAWDEATEALERDRGVIVRRVFHRRGVGISEFPYEVWRAACARAGLAGRILHDFRRTAARSYRRSGVSEGVVMQVLGHRTRSIFERYNIKNEDDLRDAAATVSTPEQGQSGANVGREQGQTGTGRGEVVPITPPRKR